MAAVDWKARADAAELALKKCEEERRGLARQIYEMNLLLGRDEKAADTIASLEAKLREARAALAGKDRELDSANYARSKAEDERKAAIKELKSVQEQRRAALKTLEESSDAAVLKKLRRKVESLERQVEEAKADAEAAVEDLRDVSPKQVLCDLVAWANERMREC